jgi:hypothetical protein
MYQVDSLEASREKQAYLCHKEIAWGEAPKNKINMPRRRVFLRWQLLNADMS